ncbi:uncharacterized protein LOC124879367 [Girardinichthys multiradiatus]|uniref:uncharacterized protein LOC124879367 n=1 Tax=Girardinichthys multiradiatus TaxID=208333 RepID=UPI001FAC6A2D|nr:uncharacterized protein LOC124879367 [Girardinichthys multiradiatus]
MMEMTTRTPEDTSELVDEILHSIFFLGKINRPAFSPRELLDDDEDVLGDLMEAHPEPFKHYSSQLPRRSPISCLLDMVVNLEGRENEDAIRTSLREITLELMANASKKVLFSSTLCVSHANKNDSVRHYGVSMSTTGRPAGQILIAASCFHFWHKYVANAVISYCPNKMRKVYFNGTFQLPVDVRCEAFKLRTGTPMNPCKSCSNMFGLDTTDTQVWPYGNCAEVESLSKLLGVEEVERRVQNNENWTEQDRQMATDVVLNHLNTVLIEVGFAWDGRFYTAQRAIPEN